MYWLYSNPLWFN